MPTIEENLAKWDGDYHWNRNGDKWSDPWGNVAAQWHGSILPRIHQCVPTGTILEIAPGFGRWTQFLARLCDRLIVVDLSSRCIAACRRRFSNHAHIEYHVNDGKSLDMIGDNSIDFAFSFDSLVHAERVVNQAYLGALGRKLKPKGRAFLHHSNLGEHATYFRVLSAIPPLKWILRAIGAETKTHGRGSDVTSVAFAADANAVGLACLCQELVNWRSTMLTDCFTTLTRGERSSESFPILRNRRFMDEARQLSLLAPLYHDSGDRHSEALPRLRAFRAAA